MTRAQVGADAGTGEDDDELRPKLRPATPEELAEFVVPSWIASYARTLPAKMMRADARFGAGRERFWSKFRKRIERTLATRGVTVTVATVDGDAIGWSCEHRVEKTVHYCYVRDGFRKQGIAKMLAGWLHDPALGTTILECWPPPWYSRPDLNTGRLLWPAHVIIDTLGD